MDDKKSRWKERFENFQKAYKFFESVLNKNDYSQLEIARLAQSFEFTFELAWKTIKDFLYEQGIVASYPREVIKIAYNTGLLEDGHLWIEMLEKRNLLSHTYDVELAENALEIIRNNYSIALKQVYGKLKEEYNK